MYNNIGSKIKTLAIILFVISVILGVVLAVHFLSLDDDAILCFYAFLSVVGGVIIGWVSSMFLYGFGELIDKTTEIARNTRGSVPVSEMQQRVVDERIQKLEKLRAQGLITEEEYQQALANKQ